MKKNTKLAIILAGLILISILISFSGRQEKRQSFDPLMFTVRDTTAVESVVIAGNATIELKRVEGRWRLNDEFEADFNMIEVLKSILSQVKVKRPVAKLNQDDIVNDLKQSGRSVTVNYKDGSTYSFVAGGNSSKKDSYYLRDDLAYLVEIPGYNNYISGIFELTKNQWRDRVLFTTTWRSLQSLNINFTASKEELEIFFNQKFLAVKGVDQLDTTSLMNYMEQFQYFQINDFLEKGKYEKYDSLLQTEHMAILTIKDIDQTKNRKLNVYPLIKGESFYLLTDEKEEMMVIDSKRMNNLLSKKDQFISN
ncbi:MAG: DUF4340 domain-containing protein [Cyclobacteriaceae bacterium]|jgi:hypothetical protein|nr:DUF4340 domain-containing protein [Cyclobacteriaceae bacterium]